MYAGSTLMVNNVITGTSQSALFAQTAIPPVIAAVVVGIAAMGMFNHK